MDIINNKLSESFGKHEYLSIGTLKVDDEYQRNKIDSHIKNIAENLDFTAFGVIEVNRRDWQNNELYIVDGLQRIEALKKAGYKNDFKVPCIVHDLKSNVEESILFTKLNVQKKKLSALQKFWPRILQNNPVSCGVLSVVQLEKFEIPHKNNGSAAKSLTNKITCIDTLEDIYKKKEPGRLLGNALWLIQKHWSNMKYNTDGNLIWGLSHFIYTYENTKYLDYKHLHNTMSKLNPIDIREEGNKFNLNTSGVGKRGGGKIWSEVFVSFYNKNLSADKKINDDEKAWIRLSSNSLDAVKKEYLVESDEVSDLDNGIDI